MVEARIEAAATATETEWEEAPPSIKLISLPNFGTYLNKEPTNFKWPKDKDLAALNSSMPLKLKALRTKGS